MLTIRSDAFRTMADDFMARKGLGNLTPVDMEVLEGDQDCVYYYYQLPQGLLELEVYFDRAGEDWEVSVTAFPAESS